MIEIRNERILKVAYPKWVRRTSLGMALLFSYVNVIHGAVEGAKTLWEERRESLARHSSRLGGGNLVQFAPILDSRASRVNDGQRKLVSVTNFIDQGRISGFSTAIASVKEIYSPPNSNSNIPLVIHIQDAHNNYEAQKNISQLLLTLSKKFENEQILVGVEGAQGSFDFEFYRSLPDEETTQQIADAFLKESFISGPEHAGLTASSTNNLFFWGIEDKKPYLEHVQAFKDAVMESEVKIQLKKWEEELAIRKIQIFNPELKYFELKAEQYKRGELKLGDYLKYLIKSPQVVIPAHKHAPAKAGAGIQKNVRLYLDALMIEQFLNYSKVEKEKKELTTHLSKRLPPSELEKLFSLSLAYRAGNLGYGEFYASLKELCHKVELNLRQWPEMEKYIRYVSLSDSIQSEKFLAELDDLEKVYRNKLTQTEEERQLLMESDQLLLQSKLTSFSLSPEEWEIYQKINTIRHSRESGNLVNNTSYLDSRFRGNDDLFNSFEKFNQAAIARNTILVENLLRKISETKSTPPKIAVLIAGGFHTPGITALLKEKKMGYVVLTPRLGNIEGSGTEYLNLFQRSKTPLEKLFSGERITLSPERVLATSTMGEGSPMRKPLPPLFLSLKIDGLVLKKWLEGSPLNSNTLQMVQKLIAPAFAKRGYGKPKIEIGSENNNDGKISSFTLKQIFKVGSKEISSQHSISSNKIDKDRNDSLLLKLTLLNHSIKIYPTIYSRWNSLFSLKWLTTPFALLLDLPAEAATLGGQVFPWAPWFTYWQMKVAGISQRDQILLISAAMIATACGFFLLNVISKTRSIAKATKVTLKSDDIELRKEEHSTLMDYARKNTKSMFTKVVEGRKIIGRYVEYEHGDDIYHYLRKRNIVKGSYYFTDPTTGYEYLFWERSPPRPIQLLRAQDIDEIGKISAHKVAEIINKKESQGKKTVLGLATGGTQDPFYRELIRLHQEEGLSLRNVITFNLDEYVGLPKDHKNSYRSEMENKFFNHVDIAPENIHVLDGTADNLELECRQYEAAIKEAGGIDLQMLGIGSNGHIAFNEPENFSVDSRTHKVELSEETIQANRRFFDGDPSKVPREALTMGIATILDAKEILLLASGESKASAIKNSIEGLIIDNIPASLLRNHSKVTFIVDSKAAQLLKRSPLQKLKDLVLRFPLIALFVPLIGILFAIPVEAMTLDGENLADLMTFQFFPLFAVVGAKDSGDGIQPKQTDEIPASELETLKKYTGEDTVHRFQNFFREFGESNWMRKHRKEVIVLVISLKENVSLLFHWLLLIKTEFGMDWFAGHWDGIQQKFNSKEKILSIAYLESLFGISNLKTYWDEIFSSYQDQVNADQFIFLNPLEGLKKVYGEEWIDGKWIELKPRLDFYLKHEDEAYKNIILPYILEEKSLAELKGKRVNLIRLLTLIEILIRANRYSESEMIRLIDDIYEALIHGIIPSYIPYREINNLIIFTGLYRAVPLFLYNLYARSLNQKALCDELNIIMGTIESGKFNSEDQIHKDLGYVLIQRKLNSENPLARPLNYKNYIQIIEGKKLQAHGDIEAQLSEEEKDELYYLAYEAARLRNFILEVKKEGRPILIVENPSYGKVAVDPIRNELERLKIELIEATIYSGECYSCHEFLNSEIFRDEYLHRILEEKPNIIVVDASDSIRSADDQNNPPHYPNSAKGFRNYILTINEASGYTIIPESSFISEETISKLKNRDDFKTLHKRIGNMAKSNYSPEPYHIGFWTPSELNIQIMEEPLEDSLRAPPILDPSKIEGPTLILTQTAMEHSAIQNAASNGDKMASTVLSHTHHNHSPAYYDDKKHFKQFYIEITPHGPDLILSPKKLAQAYYEKLTSFSDENLERDQEKTMEIESSSPPLDEMEGEKVSDEEWDHLIQRMDFVTNQEKLGVSRTKIAKTAGYSITLMSLIYNGRKKPKGRFRPSRMALEIIHQAINSLLNDPDPSPQKLTANERDHLSLKISQIVQKDMEGNGWTLSSLAAASKGKVSAAYLSLILNKKVIPSKEISNIIDGIIIGLTNKTSKIISRSGKRTSSELVNEKAKNRAMKWLEELYGALRSLRIIGEVLDISPPTVKRYLLGESSMKWITYKKLVRLYLKIRKKYGKFPFSRTKKIISIRIVQKEQREKEILPQGALPIENKIEKLTVEIVTPANIIGSNPIALQPIEMEYKPPLLPEIDNTYLGRRLNEEIRVRYHLLKSDELHRLEAARQILKLNALWQEEQKRSLRRSVGRITPQQLPRLIHYMSQDEIAFQLKQMGHYAKMSSNDHISLIRLFEKIFESGGTLKEIIDRYSTPNKLDFELLLSAQKAIQNYFFSHIKLSLERDIALKVWKEGVRKGEAIQSLKLKQLKAYLKQILTQNLETPLIHLFDITNISETKIAMLALAIKMSANRDRPVILSLLTREENVDYKELEILKERLENEFNIDPAWIKKLSFGQIVLTTKDLRSQTEQNGIDPAVEIDPDAIYSFLQTKISGSFDLEIFTDNIFRFKESWRTKALQILVIASATQVLVYTHDLYEKFRAQQLTAASQ